MVKKGKGKQGKTQKVVPRLPPQINMHPQMHAILRYSTSTSASGVNVTRRALLCLAVAVSSATQSYSIIQAIRVKRVSMWCVAQANSMVVIGLEWLDPHGPSHQLTANGTPTECARLSSKPPKNSFAELWSQVTATTTYNEVLFQVNCGAYCVLDLEFDFILSDGTNANSETISRTFAGAASVGLAYGALDNSSSAGGAGTFNFLPQLDYPAVNFNN